MTNIFYHSAEIRWFLPEQGQLAPMLHWFRLQDQIPMIIEEVPYVPKPEAAPFVKQERERPDEYLLMPDCDTTGVKQRQGKLEVKALVAGPRPFSQDGVTGRMDQWVKWSFAPSIIIANQLETELGASGPWRKVVKKRWLQKYSFDSRSLIPVSPDLYPVTGCNVELTLIDVKANVGTWLTFGFEAFGPSGQVMALLDESGRYFFARHGRAPVHLDGRDSLSYPGWLAFLL